MILGNIKNADLDELTPIIRDVPNWITCAIDDGLIVEEVKKWIKVNCSGSYAIITPKLQYVKFKLEEDATLFKLTWG